MDAACPEARARLIVGNNVIAAVVGFDVGFIEGRQTHRPGAAALSQREMVIVAAPTHSLAGQVAGAREMTEAAWALREESSGTSEAMED